MVGKKTREQQMRIIEKQENTANAGDDFDPSIDLKKSDLERERERQSQDLKYRNGSQGDDRTILRGANQKSGHRKGKGGAS